MTIRQSHVVNIYDDSLIYKGLSQAYGINSMWNFINSFNNTQETIQTYLSKQRIPPTMPPQLTEVDTLTIHAIVNDEIDQISPSPHPSIKHAQSFLGAPLTPLPASAQPGGAKLQMRMDTLCCGAHGLSLLITVSKDGKEHTLLFDTGPEEAVWERNARRLGLDVAKVERIVLSHWHRDHSGGLLGAVRMVEGAKAATATSEEKGKVVVDLHPERPDFRGIRAHEIIALEADPSFSEIEDAGAEVFKSAEAHTVLDDMFLVSGEIPRRTAYEGGIRGGVRFSEKKGWETDELIMDERLVMCNLKGKGLVVFTGCSHAGVVNVSRHAMELGGGVPLYTVVGGYHLADGAPEKLQKSLEDLKALEPKVLMPGHCTGWRFKVAIEKEMPGCMAPIFGGTKYELI
ncbi:Metallo-hydrolase/oxidoreductase [Annulohypoxylon maeteangense]|uniref:Metallo-hydrolase/oxidoreductase n=1 Tax=Annulohypoxylon maeteangense TaxID=1927788 RepID=UPI002008908E|nr:Metallo-hydrolase/oxidoreductase [Annulohypoxylon maeteangense]KAI0884783.1 Metallo-hydrolase/oxidoreductase [Annulohypoxylon maeteangense]